MKLSLKSLSLLFFVPSLALSNNICSETFKSDAQFSVVKVENKSKTELVNGKAQKLSAARKSVLDLDFKTIDSGQKLQQAYFDLSFRLGLSNERTLEILNLFIKTGLFRGKLHEDAFFKGLMFKVPGIGEALRWGDQFPGLTKSEMNEFTENLLDTRTNGTEINAFIDQMVEVINKENFSYRNASGSIIKRMTENEFNALKEIRDSKDREEIKILLQLLYKTTFLDTRTYALKVADGKITKFINGATQAAFMFSPVITGVASHLVFGTHWAWVSLGALGMPVTMIFSVDGLHGVTNGASLLKSYPNRLLQNLRNKKDQKIILGSHQSSLRLLPAAKRLYDFSKPLNLRELESIPVRALLSQFEFSSMYQGLISSPDLYQATQEVLNRHTKLGAEIVKALQGHTQILAEMDRTFTKGLSIKELKELGHDQALNDKFSQIEFHLNQRREDMKFVIGSLKDQIALIKNFKNEIQQITSEDKESTLMLIDGIETALNENLIKYSQELNEGWNNVNQSLQKYRLSLLR